MIYYFCPDISSKSGGIRRLYHHVSILQRNGFQAVILHMKSGFVIPDMPEVRIEYLDKAAIFKHGDVVVIPEGWPQIMAALKNLPIRRFVIALNWHYAFKMLKNNEDWRDYNIERVLVVSGFVGKAVSWSMKLPVHEISYSVDPDIYYYDPDRKQLQIYYLARKSRCAGPLKQFLRARNPDYLEKIHWRELDGLSEHEYAAVVRESSVLLALSEEEGLPRTALEAMSAGSIVAGFNGIGGQELLVGNGKHQNCILAESGDYITLGYRLEPLLRDMLQGNMGQWQYIVENGRQLLAGIHPLKKRNL